MSSSAGETETVFPSNKTMTHPFRWLSATCMQFVNRWKSCRFSYKVDTILPEWEVLIFSMSLNDEPFTPLPCQQLPGYLALFWHNGVLVSFSIYPESPLFYSIEIFSATLCENCAYQSGATTLSIQWSLTVLCTAWPLAEYRAWVWMVLETEKSSLREVG